MKAQTRANLTLRPFVWTNDGTELRCDKDHACAYFVDGMPDNEIVQVVNRMASGREPLWRISYPHLDAEVGDYKTPEDALSFMQRLADDPTGPRSALNRAEAAWVERWGHAPESEAAKWAYRNDVDPWKKIVKAHAR